MKSVLVRNPGGPEALELVDLPTPVPGPGEALVAARAFGVGQPDALIRKGTYRWMPPLPANPGNDVAGIVEQLGPGVDKSWLGRRVLLSARDLAQRGGCYAEYVAAPAALLHVLPDSVDFEAAVCVANYNVAWCMLHDCAGPRTPRSVLVVGAAGGVGSAAVQLARQAGMLVIGTVSIEEKRSFVLAQGADHAVNYRTEDVEQAVLAATAGNGVDLVLDHVGGPGLAAHMALIAKWGVVVSYGAVGGPPGPELFAAMRTHSGHSPALRIFSIHSYDDDPAGRARYMGNVLGLLGAGAIRPAIFARFPLRDVRQAHELLDRGAALGRIVMVA